MSSGAVRGVCELTLETDTPRALAQFYSEVLGLEVLSREPDRVWLAVGEHARLGFWSPGRKEYGDRGGRHVHFALAVAPRALDGIARRLGPEAGRVRGPVEHEGGDCSLDLTDPGRTVLERWDFFERAPGPREGVAALKAAA